MTAAEAGRDRLPITLVAVDAQAKAVGAGALRAVDPALAEDERRHRSPWLVGLVVREQDRRRGVGVLLLTELERLTTGLGYDRVWVATTADEAVEFYRRCGWRDVKDRRIIGERVQTTVLEIHVETT